MKSWAHECRKQTRPLTVKVHGPPFAPGKEDLDLQAAMAVDPEESSEDDETCSGANTKEDGNATHVAFQAEHSEMLGTCYSVGAAPAPGW